jgi:hypothetical protein
MSDIMKKTIPEIIEISKKVHSNLFFLMISTKMTMNLKDSKHHLENIKSRYDKDKEIVMDLSPMIRNCFYSYLEFLKIIKNYDKI